MIPVEKLVHQFDIDHLQKDCQTLISKVGFDQDNSQICLQHSSQCQNKWHDGTGSLPKKYPNFDVFRTIDTNYVIINDEIKHTYIFTVLSELGKHFSIFRCRLMCLRPRSCYSWHYDQTCRLHIALKTNQHCRMVFENGSWHIPADGAVYLTNTTQWHSAFNGGFSERIHLVLGVK